MNLFPLDPVLINVGTHPYLERGRKLHAWLEISVEVQQGRKPPIPREGTETNRCLSKSAYVHSRKPPIPREGTETLYGHRY